MHHETITKLLSIPGYCVTKVLEISATEIHLKVEPEDGYLGRCSQCGQEHKDEYHSSKMMKAEGLPVGERKMILHICKRRNWCDAVKAVRTEDIEWIQKGARVTKSFARQINRLTAITTNQEAGWYLGLNDEKVYRTDKAMLEEYAQKRLVPTPVSKNISVDEVAAKKYHRYLTNVVDVDEKVITWNAQGRKAEVLDRYYDSLGKDNCEKIESVALDGARTYISSSQKHAVNALIVLDRFHGTQKVIKAIDQIRKNELRKARKNEDEELIKLTNCKQRFVLMKNKKNRTSRQSATLDRLCEINQPIYLGMLLVERFLQIYELPCEDEAIAHIYEWIDDALDSRLAPFEELAWSLVEKIEYILNWFIQRRSSAISEGFNNKIKRLKRMAYGYKDVEYFKLKIHQHCGYLNPKRYPMN